MKKLILLIPFALMPGLALAGSQSFTTPGSFSVPPHSGSISIQAWGGGGGGGGAGWNDTQRGGNGGSGAPTTVSGPFGAVSAPGGAGGAGTPAYESFGVSGGSGAGGGYINQPVSASAGQVFSISIGGGGGGGGGAGEYGPGPDGGNGGAGGPAGGAGGAGGGPGCAYRGIGCSSPANSAGGGGAGAGGGGGGGSSDSQGDGGNGASGSLSGGGGGGTTPFWVPSPAPGGGVPGGGGSGGAYGGGGGAGGGSGEVVISWTDPAATCAVSLAPRAINSGQSATLSWSSSYASWVYINNIGYVNTSGSTTVAPSSTTDYSCYAAGPGGSTGWQSATLTVYQACAWNGQTVQNGSSVTAYANSVASGSTCAATSQTRTCTNGSLSGTYAYASCSCAPTYSCSNQTIEYTAASCATSAVTTCALPYHCVSGSSTCVRYAPPAFLPSAGNGQTGGLSGHLTAIPQRIAVGSTTQLYWDVSSVASCAVTGSDGESFSGASSGAAGATTRPLTTQTRFSLACTGLDGSSLSDSTIVNVAPAVQEF